MKAENTIVKNFLQSLLGKDFIKNFSPPKIKKPIVSFVCPVKNRAHLIAETIRSLTLQTVQDYELIVVDDGSDDDIQELLAYFQKKDDRVGYFLSRESKGVATSRNIGNYLARSFCLCVVDSDDLYTPKRAELSIEGLKNCDLFYGSYYEANNRGRPVILREAEEVDWKRFEKKHYTCGGTTLAYRRDKAMQTPYQWGIRYNDDYLLIMDWHKAGYSFGFTKEVLAKVRLQPDGITMRNYVKTNGNAFAL